MAVVKIWHVDNTYKPIWYVTQPKKTMDTAGRQNISALNLTIPPAQAHTGDKSYRFPADEAARQMQKTKERYHSTDGRQAYHAEQSFLPGEVTAEEAHKIGVEFAEKAWAGFEVVIATHIDKKHIHNHFIINSVSKIDGSKYRDDIKGEEYQRLRDINDEICHAHGLSVIMDPSKGRHKAYKTWQREQAGEEPSNIRAWIKEDIDRLLPTITSLPELYDRMREIGYQVDISGKYVKVKPEGKDRFFRLYKLDKHGSYAEEKLYDRIQSNLCGEYEAPEAPRQKYQHAHYRIKTSVYLTRRTNRYSYGHCMYGTYLAYRHLAKMQKTQRSYTPFPSMQLREAARDLQRFTDKTLLLCNQHIHTRSDLAAYRESLGNKRTELSAQRQVLRVQLRKASEDADVSAVRKEIESLSREIKDLSYDIRLCNEIDSEAETVEQEMRGTERQLAAEQEQQEQEL